MRSICAQPPFRATDVVPQTPTDFPVPPSLSFGIRSAIDRTLVPAKVSAPVNPPSRSPRSVDPPRSCSLKFTKPGRSKKNGSSRVPANAVPPPAMCDVRTECLYGVVVPTETTAPLHVLLVAATPVARRTT
jgi:hypothetical protein